ncbi:hypothetical protein FFLO_06341 [Filobasidium floriforme]|uniref:Uncharacterized protein n=1 Tax=Filobasidium floriforme TaxID=5210 RepID=A0A8K0JF24_9TREE|nr:uncharacterized protein HD553DRAFT_341854 [Filobasidium floriforme]KAG7528197.1 hypothetical protein FFLO_06341 [Filobasidium floriforme]KAH8085229.1 hypothetical protein HD553DRAFT_341854 [Filobasidium floriforme]
MPASTTVPLQPSRKRKATQIEPTSSLSSSALAGPSSSSIDNDPFLSDTSTSNPTTTRNSTIRKKTTQETKQRDYTRWDQLLTPDGKTNAETILVRWLSTGENYTKWKFNKEAAGVKIVEELQRNGIEFTKSLANISDKVRNLVDNWRKADKQMKQTGNGLTNSDIEDDESLEEEVRVERSAKRQKRATLEAVFAKKHPYYEDLKAVLGSRTVDSPVTLIDSTKPAAREYLSPTPQSSPTKPATVSAPIRQSNYEAWQVDDASHDFENDAAYRRLMDDDDYPEDEIPQFGNLLPQTPSRQTSKAALQPSPSDSLQSNTTTASSKRGKTSAASRPHSVTPSPAGPDKRRADKHSELAQIAEVWAQSTQLEAEAQQKNAAFEQAKWEDQKRLDDRRLRLEEERWAQQKEEQEMERNQKKLAQEEQLLNARTAAFKTFKDAGMDVGAAMKAAGLAKGVSTIFGKFLYERSSGVPILSAIILFIYSSQKSSVLFSVR